MRKTALEGINIRRRQPESNDFIVTGLSGSSWFKPQTLLGIGWGKYSVRDRLIGASARQRQEPRKPQFAWQFLLPCPFQNTAQWQFYLEDITDHRNQTLPAGNARLTKRIVPNSNLF
jgi:hypothetical protein